MTHPQPHTTKVASRPTIHEFASPAFLSDLEDLLGGLSSTDLAIDLNTVQSERASLRDFAKNNSDVLSRALQQPSAFLDEVKEALLRAMMPASAASEDAGWLRPARWKLGQLIKQGGHASSETGQRASIVIGLAVGIMSIQEEALQDAHSSLEAVLNK